MANTDKKRNSSGGNGKKDEFARWLAKLIDDAHARTEKSIMEFTRESAERTELVIREVVESTNRRFGEILVGFQEQSERHHRENVEQLRRMDATMSKMDETLEKMDKSLLRMDQNAQDHNRRLEAILERLVKPGAN